MLGRAGAGRRGLFGGRPVAQHTAAVAGTAAVVAHGWVGGAIVVRTGDRREERRRFR